MRKLNHDKRRRQRKQPTKGAITLAVETLEPRLVLSAAGFGFEGFREQVDFHHGDHGHVDAMRPAIAAQFHGADGNQRFELANRFEFNSPPPARRGDPFGGPSRGRSNDIVRAEGESPPATREADVLSSHTPADTRFQPILYAETAAPSLMVVFVSLAPSPLRGGEFTQLGQQTASLTQPPQASIAALASQQSGSASSLPVTAPVASRASIQVLPVARIDSSISRGSAGSVQPVGESMAIANPGSANFVSFTNNEAASWWTADGEPFAKELRTIDRATTSAQPAVVSSNDSAQDRFVGLAEESLWARVSEGGFIEIDTDAADSSRERFEFAEDSEDVAEFKRLSTRATRDAFWFDFGVTRRNLMLDSQAVQNLAEELALDNAKDLEEDAWLLDDGGMIVLASSQFIDQVVEVAADDTSESSSTSKPPVGEIDIPMDAGIEVFQAIEVASAPSAHQADIQAAEIAPAPLEGEATAEIENAVPSGKQAARNSNDEPSVPIRAASTPLLLALTAFLFRDRQNRKKTADRKRKA